MFQCFQNPPNSDIDYRILNVSTNINACDCTRGYTDTARDSAPQVDCEKRIPCRTGGIEPAPVACRSHALPVELHPHPLYTYFYVCSLARYVCTYEWLAGWLDRRIIDVSGKRSIMQSNILSTAGVQGYIALAITVDYQHGEGTLFSAPVVPHHGQR